MKIKTTIIIVLSGILLASCTTINHFDEYDFQGRGLAFSMTPTPPAIVSVDYNSTDSDNMFLKLIVLGTNIAKYKEAEEATVRLQSVLVGDEFAEHIGASVYDFALKSIGSNPGTRSASEYLLEITIKEYGLRTSHRNNFEFFVRVDVRIYHQDENDIVWRRVMTVSEQATPKIFRINAVVDNIFSIAALNQLTDEEIYAGITQLTELAVYKIKKQLYADFRKMH